MNCPGCGETEIVGTGPSRFCLACGSFVEEGEPVVVGVDCCSGAESGFECDCGKPTSYRGEDRVRGLE